MPERHYLERPASGERRARFYEATITPEADGARVTLRYGNPHRPGASRSYTFEDMDEARRFAQARLRAARAKGYVQTSGADEARGSKRATKRATKRAKQQGHQARSPDPAKLINQKLRSTLEWKLHLGGRAFAVFASARGCWCGNEAGLVFEMSHDGQIRRQIKLPDGVRCIVEDGDWLYAGCNDGQVYDLSGGQPRVAYTLKHRSRILWLDIHDATLYVSDAAGEVHAFNHEGDLIWSRRSTYGGKDGWMLRCDEGGVYQGDSKGVAKLDPETGEVGWRSRMKAPVYFGWRAPHAVLAGCRDGRIYTLEVDSGRWGQVFEMSKAPGPVLFSCAASEDGAWTFAADNHEQIYAFNAEGTLIWRMSTGCGAAYSMQYHAQRLYIATNSGHLGCLDLRSATLQAQMAPAKPRATASAPAKPRDIKADMATAAFIAPSAHVERVSEIGDGVLLICVEVEGRVRVRVLTEGYEPTWNVQFPRELREVGARFVVDEVQPAARGGFYRAKGEARRYEGEG